MVKRIDFATSTCTSDGDSVAGTDTWHSVIFNDAVITDIEVKALLSTGEYEYDNRLIITTPTRADAVTGIYRH